MFLLKEKLLLLFTLSLLPVSLCQSIPVVANRNSFKGDGPDGTGDVRFPGPQYMAAGAMRPPPPQAPGNPIASILGNLLGGLGALTLPPSSPAGDFYPPNSVPPSRFPMSGRLVQPPEPMIECSAPLSPHFIQRPSSGHQQHHNHAGGEAGGDVSNRTGYCVPSPMDCRGRGGSLLGPCLRYRGSNLPPQVAGACCYFETTCGQSVRVNGTHFRSPNFPDPYPSPGSCQVAIKNTYSNICQIRLDFLVFNLKQPVLGNCNADRFVVNGQSNNNILPSLCGYNPDQHSESLPCDPELLFSQLISPDMETSVH